MPRLRLALAQTNPILGDLMANSAQIVEAAKRAATAGADILAVGEMALSGYPIEDLAARPSFLREAHEACSCSPRSFSTRGSATSWSSSAIRMARSRHACSARATPRRPSRRTGRASCSTATFGRSTRSTTCRTTRSSTNTESSSPATSCSCSASGARMSPSSSAEDLWRDGGPVARVLEADAGLLLVINASPFERDKNEVRLPLVTRRATETDTIVAYVNIVGGQDDLVFDGDSVVVDGSGEILARAPQWTEHLLVVDLEVAPATDAPLPEHVTRVVLATRTRRGRPSSPTSPSPPTTTNSSGTRSCSACATTSRRTAFRRSCSASSGGIDSAVCAALAADAIGAHRVHGVSMPSRYSSEGSRSDADVLAGEHRIPLLGRADRRPRAAVRGAAQTDRTAAENVQAAARGVILMALSNLQGHLVLTTGNKTELSVGYSTIYGDSAGGFAPIKDVPKLLVWELARWRNALAAARGETPPIPVNSIEKPPSAELRPDQTDQDTLPPYDVLDGIP
ncbi:MAG: NAD(+) synthase [Galbitalea sp.]